MAELRLLLGDCMVRMAEMEEKSISMICCDPPYGLSFMGVAWDTYANEDRSNIPKGQIGDKMGNVCNPHTAAEQAWVRGRQNRALEQFNRNWLTEALRVLKPGGILKAFGGTRVFHRLASAMEDVGFADVRMEAWNYGSGFPKSHNVAVYMDRMLTEGKSRSIKRHGVGNLNGRFADAGKDFVSQSKAHTVSTPEALPWVGWGTALKPSWEPVLVGMKP